MSVDPGILDPRLLAIPRRELGDTAGTVRFTAFEGGYDVEKAERYYRDPLTGPTYWDSQNINTWSRPGKAFMCASWHRIDADANDKEYLLYPFNVSVYRFPTANMDAAKAQKATQATGTPTWAALANIYPGATAIRNGVKWRGAFYLATGENFIRILAAAETWTTLAAPAPVAGALAGQVAVGFDDKLVVWWESAGLYTYDGTTWVKIYPSTAGVVPSDASCDLIFMGPGSLQFFTRDSTGVTTWREYSIETTGTFLASWISEPGLRVWPQGGMSFQGESWAVGRLGSHRNVGVKFAKQKLAPPDLVAVLDTNLATADQKGLDFAWRSVLSAGDIAYLGGSSRQDRNACMFEFESDDEGAVINPGPTLDGVGGPIYSIAQLPYAAVGADTTERLFISVNGSTYYKDADEGDDPSDDADVAMLQFSDIDLGLEDHKRLWADISAYLLQISEDGIVEVQYRIDPQDPSEDWIGLSVLDGDDGFSKIVAPDDDPSLDLYGTRARTLQIRLVWAKPTTGTTRDILDTIAVRFAALYALGESAQ